MSEQTEKVILSKPTEFVLRGGVTIKVYPADLETLIKVSPLLKKLEAVEENSDIESQVSEFVEVVFTLVGQDNPDLNKETLKRVLTIEACTKIIQKATASA